jgi:hypothetical protein
MVEYQHVMYASKGAVEQVYSELYGDIDELLIESGSSVEGTAKSRLGNLLATISGEFSGELSESEIKKINFDDDMRKAKKLANSLMSSNDIPNIADVYGDYLELDQLYRFSCEVMTVPFESELDGENYINVSGMENNIRFEGDTSVDNWGRRSHIIQSVRAAERDDSYPYQGLMWPLKRKSEESNQVSYDVNYVLICGPERELRKEWYGSQ